MSSVNYNRALSQRGLWRQVSTTQTSTPDGERFYLFTCGPEMLEELVKEICPSAKFVGVGCVDGFKLVFRGESEKWRGALATPAGDDDDGDDDDNGDNDDGRILGVVWSILRSEVYLLDTYDGGQSPIKSIQVTTRGQSVLRCRAYEAAAAASAAANQADLAPCEEEEAKEDEDDARKTEESLDSGVDGLVRTDGQKTEIQSQTQSSSSGVATTTPTTKLRPSALYMRLCIAGAMQHDLPPTYLRKLRQVKSASIAPAPGALSPTVEQAMLRMEGDSSDEESDSDF